MRLIFKQRLFSWFDSYDIYDEAGNTVFTVEGQLSWGHCLKIFDPTGSELGTVKQRVFALPPKFDLYRGDARIGCIQKEFKLFSHHYNIDCNGWHVEGNWLGWDYSIVDAAGRPAASISKELWNWTDTYVIDVVNPQDALTALMVVLAIDAEKCSSGG